MIFGLSLWLRFRVAEVSKIPFLLSILGVLVIGFGGWLGGEMVYVKGMAVEAWSNWRVCFEQGTCSIGIKPYRRINLRVWGPEKSLSAQIVAGQSRRYTPFEKGSFVGKFLFEIHDQPWFPAFLRDQTTDALQFVLDAGHIYAPIAPRLRKALSDTRTNRVIDLCSGAGGPWASLHNSLKAEGTPPVKIFLTDKYPHATEMLNAGMPGPDGIDSYPEPIDATNVPAKLKGFRTMFSSFHHFETTEARAILQDAVDKKEGIAIFEAAGTHALTLFSTLLLPLGTLLLLPFMRPFQWSRLIWTYLIPVVPFVMFFDGLMSCLRSYSLRELNQLTEDVRSQEYRWSIGEEHGGLFPVAITYLIGQPSSAGQAIHVEGDCPASEPLRPAWPKAKLVSEVLTTNSHTSASKTPARDGPFVSTRRELREQKTRPSGCYSRAAEDGSC